MEKKRSKKEQEATAYHEAGHAVVALERGIAVKSVNIIQDKKAERLGLCEGGKFPKWFQPDGARDAKTRLLAENHIIYSLAGVEAERKVTGRYNRVGARGDEVGADKLAEYFCESNEEKCAFVKWLTERTRNILNKEHVWLKVEAVAKALLEREHLSAKELVAICRKAMIDGMNLPANAAPR